MSCGNDYACDLVNKLGLTGFWGRTVHFLLNRPLKILFVLLVASVLARVLGRLARRAVEKLSGAPALRRSSSRADQRIRTLAGVTGSIVRVIVWTIASFTVLGILGLNLGPLIAGASIVGVALGFGAQSLVRDFLSGFFILVEDQYGVGDQVTVAGAVGTVEEVNLRVTRLRANDGAVWFLPNGEIRKVANASMGWARVNVDLLLPLDTDLEQAMALVAEEAAALAQDPAWADDILDPPEVLGVDAMTADGFTVRAAGRVTPTRKDAFGRALRARVGARLRAAGIALAKPPAAAAPVGDQPSADGE